MKVMIRKLTQTQMIVIGYALIILTGALLLMLPAASRDGLATSFPDALFTATSASCVTGLVIADTFSKWTMFGQCIILAMIQIGGLGFMTIGVFFCHHPPKEDWTMDAGDAARERQHSADWRNCPAGKKDHAGNPPV